MTKIKDKIKGVTMRILGIDPGYAITGYSIIDYQGNKFKLIDSRSSSYKSW